MRGQVFIMSHRLMGLAVSRGLSVCPAVDWHRSEGKPAGACSGPLAVSLLVTGAQVSEGFVSALENTAAGSLAVACALTTHTLLTLCLTFSQQPCEVGVVFTTRCTHEETHTETLCNLLRLSQLVSGGARV